MKHWYTNKYIAPSAINHQNISQEMIKISKNLVHVHSLMDRIHSYSPFMYGWTMRKK